MFKSISKKHKKITKIIASNFLLVLFFGYKKSVKMH